MNIIVCAENNLGMAFNRRRVSQDSEVVKKIAEITDGEKLWMNGYSAKLFTDAREVFADEDFLLKANQGDFCFVEIDAIPMEMIENLYLFRWNRNYPADLFLNLDLKGDFKKIKKEEFSGSSHKKITLEIYKRV